MRGATRLPVAVLLIGAAGLLTGCFDRPPVEAVQNGFRGTGMEQVYNPRDVADEADLHAAPPEVYPQEPGDGPKASEIYENVEVLGDLSEGQFLRIMTAITEWVSPEQGCAYCHGVEGNFASEEYYAKRVARHMIRMTQEINAEWDSHVGQVGVTCYTCHRGNNLPMNIWYEQEPYETAGRSVGWRNMQNFPDPDVGLASLPGDPFTPYILEDQEIRVIGDGPLPIGGPAIGTKQTEWTYGLMMHMSTGLGVNCTYCHNTRSMGEWAQSPAPRVTAWHGIEMSRWMNNEHIVPITSEYTEDPYATGAQSVPEDPTGILTPELLQTRVGPLGDIGKVNCATCHQGAYKPLYGANMVKDYPSLWGGANYSVAPDPGGALPEGTDSQGY